MARRTWWKVGALLAAMMVFLTMLPVTALAAEGAPGSLYVAGQQITDEGYYTQSGGNWTKSGDASTPPSAPYFHYTKGNDNTPATLTLSGATIQGGTSTGSVPYGAGIYAQCKDSESVSLTIELIGNNTITGYYGIYVNAEISENSNGTDASLTITGENNVSLEVSGSFYGIFVKSGTGNASVTIENASVDAKTTQTNSGYAGVCVQSGASSKDSPNLSLAVNGGSLTTSGSASGDGIQFVVGAHVATRATTSLAVTDNAIVDARNGGISASRTSVTLPTPTPTGNNSSGIVFDDKNGTVYGEVTLDESLTINQGETLTIPEGSTLNTNNKLTNNGTINVESGGSVSGNLSGGTPLTTPSISQQPQSTTVTEGSTAEFSITASDAQTYQWQRKATYTESEWENISDATTTSYTTAATTTNMNGYQYRCVVTGSGSVSVISQTATLTVQAKPASVPVTGVTLDKTTLELFTGGSATLTATVQPDDATNKNVTWQSDNANVATVQNGTVNAVGAGEATITVTTEDGNKTATCAVTVEAATVPVTGVTLSQSQARLYYNGTPNMLTLVATVAPDNATDKAVAWTSSNSAVATVDGSGNVTAVAPGTATITVTTADGGMTATCLVTVTGVYIPPRPTGPDWGDVADDIADAEPGSTVTVDMDGKTVLPGEVLDELAGRDVTLALDMGDGVSWEIYGGDVPESEGHDDVDLGVALGGDDIPADVANLVTGESGSVQVSLEHDGPFGFELTLVAPLGEDAAGLVANLYRYDDEAGSLGYEASAQVDNEGVARLPFDHASSWLVVLDSRSHALPFSDAAEGEWYSEAVRWAWLSGLMAGYGDGSGAFGTEGALSRAQLATVLWRQAGEPEAASEASFADCDPGAFYAEAVAWADEAGIIEGYGDGTNFGPEDPVTREQLATILWRAAGEPEGKGDLSDYPDGDKATGYAVPALEWAVGEGVLSGFGGGSLAPGGVLSRAQLAAVLMRLAQEVA